MTLFKSWELRTSVALAIARESLLHTGSGLNNLAEFSDKTVPLLNNCTQWLGSALGPLAPLCG